MILPAALPLVNRRFLSVPALTRCLLLLVIAGGLLWPVLGAQAIRLSGYTRSAETIRNNSARLIDYARANPSTLGSRTLPWFGGATRSDQRLYPGSGLIAFALLGSAVLWKQRQYRVLASMWLLLVTALAVSLGPRVAIGDWQPYDLLRQYHPGFTQLRSPFRAAVFVQIALVALAGIGLTALWRWRAWVGRILAIGVVTISLAEGLAFPARLYALPAGPLQADWVAWLSREAQPDGAVAMIPFPARSTVNEYEATVIAMLQALEHHHPIVNGYSGWFPLEYRRLRRAMVFFPDARSQDLLCRSGAVYWVVDTAALSEAAYLALADWPTLYAAQGIAIYEASDHCP
jgi:hypothetical protein